MDKKQFGYLCGLLWLILATQLEDNSLAQWIASICSIMQFLPAIWGKDKASKEEAK